MRPTDLKLPYNWKTPEILIRDKVLHIPGNYENPHDFVFPGWYSQEVFEQPHPIFLEYCSGNGAWIADKAFTSKQTNWVAVERQFDRVRKIWSKAKNQELSNLFIVCGEALKATQHYFASESIDHIFINFPDPWPKRRHAKNRLIQPLFVSELWRILKFEGTWSLVTDDPTYGQQALSVGLKMRGWAPCFESPYYSTDLAGYGSSYFEELWRSQGREIRHYKFKKIDENCPQKHSTNASRASPSGHFF